MRLISPALLCLVFLIGCLDSKIYAQEKSDSFSVKKHFDIKSCKLVYKFFNGPQQGEKTVIFDNWGNVSKMFGVTRTDTALLLRGFSSDTSNPFMKQMRNSILNQSPERHQLAIRTQEETVDIDLDKKVGYKHKSISLDMFHLEEELKSHIKIVGEGRIAGKLCEIQQEDDFMKSWMWNKIVLKKQSLKTPPEIKMEEYVIEIDENYIIKPDEFKIPEDIIVK